MQRFETHHWFGNPLDEPMVLFKNVVDSLRSRQIGSTFINGDFVWNTIACYGFLKETPCSPEISPLGEHEIERLPVTINGPI